MYAYKYACTDGIQVYKDMVSSSDDEGGSCPELVSDSENDEGSWEHLRTLEAERRGRGESSSGEAIDESFHEHRITPMPRRGRSWASDATTIRGPPPTMQNISGVSADEWEELDGYGRMAARMEYVEARTMQDAEMLMLRRHAEMMKILMASCMAWHLCIHGIHDIHGIYACMTYRTS
jgi:hypothetical protein